ncbi:MULTISPECIES: glycoside hydrolase family 99-like domain-containing protein [Falsihalocynthiibacter]|uniref:glycoside hydrolase family 99-like domain-containing protein n=1 Tax=Falsihalocynthiibacter TaxID=2854182 RepID=UPI003002528D
MTPSAVKYVNILKRSPEFDRGFYLRTNSNINRFYHRFPERHYVLYGESLGLRPNPDFAPRDYMRLNKDIGPEHRQALRHYLERGKNEGRATAVRPGASSRDGKKTAVVRPLIEGQKAKFAIVIHVFYHDLWSDFKARLLDLDIEFDLFVTATFDPSETDEMFADIRATFPSARCFELHNHGRDIFPFVYLANSSVLDGYSAICKFHTKKSPHRTDGEKWRDHLISGLLDGQNTSLITDAFLADETAGFLVADGQHFTETRWWGSNFERTKAMLARVEVPITEKGISFPAGSIYWLKPEILSMIKGMRLTEDDFEYELGQVDGTLAHAFERGVGFLATNGGQTTRQTSEIMSRPVADPLPLPEFTSCFYLPQFHPTEMNDKWWGKGFTEWTSTVAAKPQYKTHQQPVLPADLGFYDLRLPSVMGQQAELAKDAGIDAFCVYHYWFDRTRILETPMNNLLNAPEIDFPFYLCWANESWRRNWDGLSGEILLDQSYGEGFEERLVEDSLPYMRDARYQRPNGRDPRFVIYRPEDMPNPVQNVALMRQAWRDSGIGEVELGAVRFHISGDQSVAEDVFDFWIEMPPHGMVVEKDLIEIDSLDSEYSGSFSGLIYSYDGVIENSAKKSYVRGLPANTIAGVMPSWDNTARRGAAAHMAYGANPQSFDRWLKSIRAHRLEGSYRNELFINAWNEWAENAILEPSKHYGSAYLETAKRNIKPRSLG